MGRSTYSGRGLVEHRANISIRRLTDKKLLTQGNLIATWEGGITETRGVWSEEVAWVKYRLQIEGVIGQPGIIGKMIFETKYNDQTYMSYHLIEAQPVNLGGHRYYFICGRCGRRVKAIYYGYTGWACRHCCQLVYEASREHRSPYYLRSAAENARKKAEYLRQTNHPRLANRMDAKADAQEQAQETVFEEHFLRRFGHLL